MTDRSVAHDTFSIERTYPAGPERVFAAWASQPAKAQWFADTDDLAIGEHTLDFRVGGREHLGATLPGGLDVRYDALYQDIVENERIVASYDMHIGGRRISVSLQTVELAGVPGGTRLILTEHGAYLDGLDTNAQREAGTRGQLDKLGVVLAAHG